MGFTTLNMSCRKSYDCTLGRGLLSCGMAGPQTVQGATAVHFRGKLAVEDHIAVQGVDLNPRSAQQGTCATMCF